MIATTLRSMIRAIPLARLTAIAGALIALGFVLPEPASARVSANVRNACMSDYFQYCAGMEVGSQELRRCFNRNGSKLSSGCVSALVSAGEVSQAEVSRRSGTKVASKSRSGKRTASRSSRRQYATLR